MTRHSLALILLCGAVAAPLAAASGTGVVVKTAYNKTLKTTILVDGAGRTLYLLTSDPKNLSTCASLDPTCPRAWPPLGTGRDRRQGRTPRDDEGPQTGDLQRPPPLPLQRRQESRPGNGPGLLPGLVRRLTEGDRDPEVARTTVGPQCFTGLPLGATAHQRS